MPVYMPFMGHKEMVPLGATLLCQTPPPTVSFCLSFIVHSYLSPSPLPTLTADPKTITFFKLLLAFPDLLP